MISARSCSKSSAYFNGKTRFYCTTHNHDMEENSWQCSHGELEVHLMNQVIPVLNKLHTRVQELEKHINDHLKTFAANLEKLHERDPTPPT